MADEQVEQQGKGNEEILAQAQGTLQLFLDENYQLIRAVRSKAQFRAQGTPANKEAELKINTHISRAKDELMAKRWALTTGVLCRVSGVETKPDHSPNEPMAVNEIRGMKFSVIRYPEDPVRGSGGGYFYCLELDSGLSRKYYDLKDEEGKEEFIIKALHREEPNANDPSHFFGAAISDQGGKYQVEKIVSA